MRSIPASCALVAWLASWAAVAHAQPLAKPLADFDQMAAELKTSSVVGEPIRAGGVIVVPFASVQFGLGSAGASGGFAGGMGVHTVPLGVVIVEGDDARVELLASQEKTPSMMHQLIQGIIDRKIVFMGNGVNLGHATGNVADLTAMVTGLMGQTTWVGNGLNVGSLTPPAAAVTADKTIADLEAAAAKNPTAENYYNLGAAWQKKGQKDKAAAAYRKALELTPGYPKAVRALASLKE
jgi:uncharacterized spore protein YtfJ